MTWRQALDVLAVASRAPSSRFSAGPWMLERARAVETDPRVRDSVERAARVLGLT